jgi:hypothetical protein
LVDPGLRDCGGHFETVIIVIHALYSKPASWPKFLRQHATYDKPRILTVNPR